MQIIGGSFDGLWLLKSITLGYVAGSTLTVAFMFSFVTSRFISQPYRTILTICNLAVAFVSICLINVGIFRADPSIWLQQNLYMLVFILSAVVTLFMTLRLIKPSGVEHQQR